MMRHLVAIAGFYASSLFAQSSSHGKPTSLRILPSVSRACPGDVIEAQYEIDFADGARETLGGNDVRSLIRSSQQAQPKNDGSWQTSSSALDAAFFGYRLSAKLTGDSSIHADTVVAPAP